MRLYVLETSDGQCVGMPFAAEDDSAATRQVLSVFAPAVLAGNTEFDDISVVCLFSFDKADPRSSLISLHEEVATVGEVFAAALVKFLAARPEVDFDKLEVKKHAEES